MIEGKLNIAFDKIKEKYINEATNKFIEIGERCITEARDNGSYADRTGNLRNSVGYMVLLDGVVQSQGNINKHNQEQIEKIKAGISSGRPASSRWPAPPPISWIIRTGGRARSSCSPGSE